MDLAWGLALSSILRHQSPLCPKGLAQALCLPWSSQSMKIVGVAALPLQSLLHSIAAFDITVSSPSEKFWVTACVTCNLPLQPIHQDTKWTHLSDLHFADPDFGHPGKIDILLGIDIYADVLLHGWRNEPPGSPTAFETKFGWVLVGRAGTSTSPHLPVLLPFTTSLLLPLMHPSQVLGYQRKSKGWLQPFPWRMLLHAALLWDTQPYKLRKVCHFPPRINKQYPLKYPDPKPSGDSSHWIASCIQRINSQSFLLWWRNISRCNVENLSR